METIEEQLDSLLELKDGWLNGYGTSFNPNDIKWIKNLFNLYYPENFISPYIYPTETNSISIEWDIPGYGISLEIFFNTHIGHYHNLYLTNKLSNFSDVVDMYMDEERSWKKIINRLTKLM